ncbi:MAG: VOC family protein [Pseudomonadales bacterium]|jgi:catechol 2,3-dioxygenase-like lactoylglutathione lyase family enzyme|nr:VOC family protein [Pseudomonadales bacterium]
MHLNDKNSPINSSISNSPISNSPISPLRRSLLGAVPALLLGRLALAQSSSGIRLRKLHNFEIRVSDPGRSARFYQGLFGMPVQARDGERLILKIGDSNQFMAIRPRLVDEPTAITHIGYTVEDYDLARLQAALEGMGFKPIAEPDSALPGLDNAMCTWVKRRGETSALFFADERGLIVQLSDPSYCGGGGPLGANCPAPEPVAPGLLRLQELNHFTAFVSDGAAANTFYQQAFDLKVQAYQGPNAPVTGIGDGHQFVMYAGAGGARAPATLNHGSFNMYDFDVDKVRAKLSDYGLSPRPEGQQTTGPLMHYVSLRQPERGGAPGGTPELYFTDPDGILLQLQDVTYCGGGGYLGSECLKDA